MCENMISRTARVETLEGRRLLSGAIFDATTYPMGSDLDGTTIGDFNRDGKVDVAAIDSQTHTFKVLLNRGDGTLTTRSRVKIGAAQALAAADFDGDGNGDVAVLLSRPGSDYVPVRLFLGNGDGAFRASKQFYWVRGYDTLVASDVNADGLPDLVAGADEKVSVLINRGSGTFAQAAYYGVGLHRHVGTKLPVRGHGSWQLPRWRRGGAGGRGGRRGTPSRPPGCGATTSRARGG